MNLNELLFTRNLTTALIVDDGYDETPKAQDLAGLGATWETFFEDINEGERTIIVEAFPGYDSMEGERLRESDEFVATIWNLRTRFRPEVTQSIFEQYSQALTTDTTFLKKLELLLAGVGLEVVKAGREIPEAGKTASVIFVDLFLGSNQNDGDLEASLSRIKSLLAGREDAPPIVVLMSRSPRLGDKRTYFRDKALLLGAMFRVLSKNDLANEARFKQSLYTLASHYDDALRLASFLHCWDRSLVKAKTDFLTKIRRLDLSDYGQLRELLLNFDGQPLGSYVLDVFDRVLQHQIESDVPTITAAEGLNQIQIGDYAPPYIAGSPDLQQMVFETIFQHPERLKVQATESGAPVAFGDLLVRRDALIASDQAPSLTRDADIRAILTPPCDLARSEFQQSITIGGNLEVLKPNLWSYKEDPLKTPIVILPDGRRMWIRWDLKDIQTFDRAALLAMIGAEGSHVVLIRLRETHAIELQQKLLADLGRVGLVAHMPATFPVSVDVYTVDTKGELISLPIPSLQQDGAVCYTGRGKEPKQLVSRLILHETAIAELTAAVAEIDAASVHQRCQEALKHLKASLPLPVSFSVPAFGTKEPIPLNVRVRNEGGTEVELKAGSVWRNPPEDMRSLDGNNLKSNSLLLIVRDHE